MVSYSEAIRLATPAVVKESIKITLSALHEYRNARKTSKVPNMKYNTMVKEHEAELIQEAREAIRLLEENITDLYSPEGFYKVFINGFFPVPYLMDQNNCYPQAKAYTTAIKGGGISVVDEEGSIVNTKERYMNIINNMKNASV